MENLVVYVTNCAHNLLPILFKLYDILEFWYLDLFISDKIIWYPFVYKEEQILHRLEIG